MGEQEEYNQALHADSVLKGTYQTASSMSKSDDEQAYQLIRVLTEHENFLTILRQELRGEQLYQDENGERSWVQVDKPAFVKLDRNNKPLRKFNQRTKKEEYICNDDAVNEVLSTLKFTGLNAIAPTTIISEDEIRADLYEMESKIAILLFNKRKEWGLQKPEYPMMVGKLKVLIKDARYRAVNGTIIKALRTVTSRIEQSNEAQRQKVTMGQRVKNAF